MRIDKLFSKTRAERLKDPDIIRGLDLERDKMKASLWALGNQTKETCADFILKDAGRSLRSVRGGTGEFLSETGKGALSASGRSLALVARILLTTGRAVKYGIRKSAAI